MPQVYVGTGVSGIEEARARGRVAVLVDALRASGTIATLLAAGAERVLVVGEPAQAFALRRALGPGRRPVTLVGERGGVKIPGFDRGNEPVVGENLAGTVVFTSSNCASCCLAAADLPAWLLGHTINATACAQLAAEQAARAQTDIMLVAAGFSDQPERINLEDFLTCGCLIEALGWTPGNDAAKLACWAWQKVTPAGLRSAFAESDHGRHLLQLGRAADIAYLAQIDVLELVPVGSGVVEMGGVWAVEVVGKSLPRS
jgi:2-phosphosulfolactate phosphatase